MGTGVGGTGTTGISMLGRRFVIGVGDNVVVGFSEFVESVGDSVCIVGVLLDMIDIINDSKQFITKVIVQYCVVRILTYKTIVGT